MAVSQFSNEVSPTLLAATAFSMFMEVCIHLSAIALLLYDTLLTMGREVRLIWSRSHATTTGLYIVGRYSATVSSLLILVAALGWNGQNTQACTAIYWIGSLLTGLSLFAIAYFSAVRVFVMSGKSLWQSLAVLTLGLYPSAMYAYFPTTLVTTVPGPLLGGCGYGTNLPLSKYQMLASSTRIASMAADLPALLVTLRHTYRTAPSGRRRLTQILFVDGSVYFSVVCLLSSIEIVFLALAWRHVPESDIEAEITSVYFQSISAALAALTTTLNVVLMCRFLLNLCEAASKLDMDSSGSTPSALTSVAFASRGLAAHQDDAYELVTFERRTMPTLT